jgi:general secretion pathway protein D
MKIGERIPIATGSYSTGVATTVTSSLVNTQFQYIDVGINIEMTPTIHYDHDVTLKIKIEDSSENGSSTISGVTEPIIAQKTSEQVIRLREGEASVLSGMVNKTDIQSWSGIPGLSSIPGLKYLFGSKDHQIQEDEIVFLVIPHIVRSTDIQPANLRTIDTGVGTSIDLHRVANDASASTAAASPSVSASNAASSPTAAAARPAARSQVGTVPGQSAAAAAPAALAQMNAAANSSGEVAAANVNPPTASPQANINPPAASPQVEGVSFALTPPAGPVAVGATFKVPVVLSGGADIVSVPLQISYDPAKLSLVNVEGGDLLSRDGQAVAVVHRDEPQGLITLNVARPPGAAGVSGSTKGTVCVLSFQAKAAGTSDVVITRPSAVNSAQQMLTARGARTTIQVQ